MTDTVSVADVASLPAFGEPVASPSGDRVAYVSDEHGSDALYVRRLDGEEGHRRLTDDPALAHGGGPLVWLPDGSGVVYHLGVDGNNSRAVARATLDGETESLFEREGTCTVTAVHPDGDRVLFRSSEAGPDDVYEHSLTTGETERLTDRPGRIAEAHYGPDDRIVYRHSDEGTRGKSVHVLDRATGDHRQLPVGEPDSYTDVEAWNRERNVVLVQDDASGKRRCGLYDPTTRETTWLTDDDRIEGAVALSPDGSRAVVHRTEACTVTPVVYDTDTGVGEPLDLTDGFGKVPTTVHGGFRSETELLVAHETPRRPRRLLTYDCETGATELVYDPAGERIDTDALVGCEYERIESFDGLELETLVYDSGVRPSPLVAQIHGGPLVQDYRSFDPLTQSLTAAGYSVVKVNYRGSKGRGTAFRRRLIDEPGNERRDVAAVVETVADRDWVADDRVAAVGDSFGGYCVLMQLALHGELYAGGIAMSPPTELETLLEDTLSLDADVIEQFTGDWSSSVFRQFSPLYHADEITAPLCLIHGTADQRVPLEQTHELVDALTDAGRATEPDGSVRLHELTGLGHNLGHTDTREQVFELFLLFLDDYVTARETADSEATATDAGDD